MHEHYSLLDYVASGVVLIMLICAVWAVLTDDFKGKTAGNYVIDIS